MMADEITDEMLSNHHKTFNTMITQITGLHMIALVLESRSKILIRDSGKSDTTDILDFNVNLIHEVAQHLRENINKFANEEEEMIACIDGQLKEIIRMREL